MILFVHLLFGAAIGSIIKNPFLAIILAFLGHYLLDLIPHIEYPIPNIENKQWKKSLPDFIKVFLDIALGLLAIFLLSKNQPIIYVCAFFGVLPDGLSLLGSAFPNKIAKMHEYFHWDKIHFLKDKKISRFWRVFSQILVAVISVYCLKV